MNRVVITGIGIVSPVGCTLSDFWSALVEARSGVGPITIIPTEGLLIRIAAQVLGFDPTAHFESRQANLLDRFARFAVVAARAAVRDAELEIDEPHALEAVTIVGSGVGGQVAMDVGLKGPTYSVATACASGTHAIGQAFHLLRMGQVPFALAGGSEACLTFGTLKGWEALRVLTDDACRPFSKTRSGLVLGEGAAILVLETRDRALARGARVY